MTTKKPPTPKAGHNTKRSLDLIGWELQQRRDIFESGRLLCEGKEACAHGEWLPWLEAYFDASADTAERHMAAYHLSLKFRTVRDLRVPVSIIYQLAGDFDHDDPALPTIIDALDDAWFELKEKEEEQDRRSRSLSVDAAKEVIELTKLRIKFGNYPDATLRALWFLDEDNSVVRSWAYIKNRKWVAGAIEELKKARPDTKEAADKILDVQHRKYFEVIGGVALPDWCDAKTLEVLNGVEKQHLKHLKPVLQNLHKASPPLDWDQVCDIAFEESDEPEHVEPKQEPEPETVDEQGDEPDHVEPKQEPEPAATTETSTEAAPEPTITTEDSNREPFEPEDACDHAYWLNDDAKPKEIAEGLLSEIGVDRARKVLRALEKRLAAIKTDCPACKGTGFMWYQIEGKECRFSQPCDCGPKAEEYVNPPPPQDHSYRVVVIAKDGKRWENGVRLKTREEAETYIEWYIKPDFERAPDVDYGSSEILRCEGGGPIQDITWKTASGKKARRPTFGFPDGKCYLNSWHPEGEAEQTEAPTTEGNGTDAQASDQRKAEHGVLDSAKPEEATGATTDDGIPEFLRRQPTGPTP
jgi:hypothetical protein